MRVKDMSVWSDVLRITRSPMNAQRWCVEMACGHEVWTSGARKPQCKKMLCFACKKPEEARRG